MIQIKVVAVTVCRLFNAICSVLTHISAGDHELRILFDDDDAVDAAADTANCRASFHSHRVLHMQFDFRQELSHTDIRQLDNCKMPIRRKLL